MPRTVNRATILGYCGGDPRMKEHEDGRLSCTFSVATANIWRDKTTEERREDTQWHRVTVYGPYAHWCDQLLKRGKRVYVEGFIRYWTRKTEDGQTVKFTDIVVGREGHIVFLDNRPVETKRRRLPGEAFDPFEEGDEEKEGEKNDAN